MTTKLILAVAAAAFLFSGSLYATYRIGYHDGAQVGYDSGVMQHRLYAKGHAMASDWNTYSWEHQRQFWKR